MSELSATVVPQEEDEMMMSAYDVRQPARKVKMTRIEAKITKRNSISDAKSSHRSMREGNIVREYR